MKFARVEVEVDAWVVAGRRLRSVDPIRFAQLLELAEQIVDAHENPDTPVRPSLLFRTPDRGDTSVGYD